MNRLEKGIAVALQGAAGVLLYFAGNMVTVDDVYILTLGIPGIVAGVSGLLLWGKATRQPLLPPVERPFLPPRDDTPGQELLASLQEELGRMREEREFIQQLYGAEPALWQAAVRTDKGA